MKKVLLGSVLLAAVWNLANTASVAQDAKPCVNEYYGTFNIGKHALTKQCGVVICKEDGKLDVDVCPAISVAAGSVIIPEDLSKPHPECCERAIKAEDAKPCVNEYYGTFNIGKHALTKQCGVAICKENGKLDVDICPSILLAPGYILVPEDLSKPHPECCEKGVKA